MFLGACLFEQTIDKGFNAAWRFWNKGKLWEDYLRDHPEIEE